MITENPIFIVGSSRSGTTFLGQVLKRHDNIHCTIERPPAFHYASHLALNPHLWEENPAQVSEQLFELHCGAWKRHIFSCRSCSRLCRRSGGVSNRLWSTCHRAKDVRRVADKSHQHVLNVPAVLAAFPKAQFLHVVRDGRDVLASMLRHKGIRSWFSEEWINSNSRWPHPWFGVEDARQFDEWRRWNLAKKCALRWVSWVDIGLSHSDSLLPHQWLDVRYEDLVGRPEEAGEKIFAWLGLPMDFDALADARDSSVGGWTSKLTKEEISDTAPIIQGTLERLQTTSVREHDP